MKEIAHFYKHPDPLAILIRHNLITDKLETFHDASYADRVGEWCTWDQVAMYPTKEMLAYLKDKGYTLVRKSFENLEE